MADLQWNADLDGCQVGAVSVRRVAELENIPFAASDIYADQSEDIIRGLKDIFGARHIDPKSLALLLSFHSFVVRSGGRTILVDACVGNHKARPTRPAWHLRDGAFLADLAAAGVAPEDVDVVLCTHLHADHVGWNTKLENGAWKPTFPNAEYLFAEKEYAHWKQQFDANPTEPLNYGSFEDSVLPVVAAGQATMVAGDHRVESGIYLEPAYGHTPGNVLVHLEGGGDHAILSGDVIHHLVQLAHPDWSTNFCFDGDQSRRTRIGLLESYAGTKTLLLPAHFQAPEYGRIQRDGKQFRIER